MDTKQIRLKQEMLIGNRWHSRGDVVSVGADRAKHLIETGAAIYAPEGMETATAPTPKLEVPEATEQPKKKKKAE